MSHENIMRLWNDAATGGRVRPKLRIRVKTSDYTVTSGDFGTVFTTRGAAAAVTFTLPAAASTNTGEWVLFINVADYNLTVAGAEEGLVVFNNLTADNIGFGTAGEKIGGTFLAISDGTSWIVLPLATETQTLAVDTSSTSTATATTTSTATASTTASATTSTSKSTSATTSATATVTATGSGTKTDSPTATVTSTRTATDTQTATSTQTQTPSATGTSTSTATATATP